MSNVLLFPASLYERALGYSSITTDRSALTSLDFGSTTPVGNHASVCRLMRGVFDTRPTMSRYSSAWDVKDILNFFRQGRVNSELKLKQPSMKTATLVALISAQRVQSQCA